MSEPLLAHELIEPESGGGAGSDRDGTAAADRWTYFLHGIFGAGRNWRSVARRWVDAGSLRGGVLVDLRLHGDSTGFRPPHTIRACADDVRRLARATGKAPSAVLGHSFGGKVALEVATRGEGLRRAWIIDSTPAAREEPEGSAVRMLEALRAEDGPFGSREDAQRALMKHGFAAPVARWMITNLTRTEAGWTWRLDLDGMQALLEDFFEVDLWPVVEEPPPGLELHFVKATRSPVLTEEACERIEAAGQATGRVHLHRVEGGHWLNVDAPDRLLELMESADRGGADGHES